MPLFLRALSRRFSLRTRLALAAAAAATLAAACTAVTNESDQSQDALLGNWTTPDPNNDWTKGVDLSKLAIGEETRLPGEDALFGDLARTIEGMQDALAAQNGGVRRGFHAKAHACVRGELHVNVPATLPQAKVGLFADNKTYPTWVRYSNGVGFSQSDKSADVRGVGIKVMKVPGTKLLPGHEHEQTQDFLLTNGAATPAPDAKQFVAFGKAMVDAEIAGGQPLVGPIEKMLKTGGYLLRPENTRVREYLINKAIPRVLTRGSILGEQFWTGGAVAFGIEDGDPMTARASQAAKLTVVSGVLDNGRCVSVNQAPNLFDDKYFRTDVKKRLAQSETCLDVRVQFQKDPMKQPIEDTSVEWRESDSPFTSIAYIVVPKTDLEHDAHAQAAESFCNELGFTPWHALPEHRPIGNIMRARKPVYEASHGHRNGHAEPTGDETF